MFIILKKGHQPGVYVPLRALFLVVLIIGNAQFRRAMLSCDSSCLTKHYRVFAHLVCIYLTILSFGNFIRLTML